MQHASRLLMIEPVQFGYNAQTAVNNAFQVNHQIKNLQEKALREFNDFVQLLRDNNIDVTVVKDTLSPPTPDSLFPNNWISFHEDSSIVLYPMFAENRREERKQSVLDVIKQQFNITHTTDLSYFETTNKFLEGTGSMVLDRINQIAYACLSPRTNRLVLEEFCSIKGYRPVSLIAKDQNGQPVYHTNVLMCIADTYTVICLDAIADEKEKNMVKGYLIQTHKEIIPISTEQMHSFAGNMLQVINTAGEKILVMSDRAYRSLTKMQLAILQQHNRILHTSLEHIEAAGGGSARCMLAEVFTAVK